VGLLLFVPTFTARFIAWLLFLIAAFSDLWDGHLARKYGWISDFGKLVDPIADKLLLVTTFVPFYILSHRSAIPTASSSPSARCRSGSCSSSSAASSSSP
jgi:phosphatidylglycerophosphate synthase